MLTVVLRSVEIIQQITNYYAHSGSEK
jgi:hypothetical protein